MTTKYWIEGWARASRETERTTQRIEKAEHNSQKVNSDIRSDTIIKPRRMRGRAEE